ncbi:MAG: hypothetical protein KIH63_000115 [Candidatus Saccharibacteria bacterium]|nr:hypothetical protein [Candidatus Saccharibacteria bacterium]
MSTASRLERFGLFSDDLIGRVSEIAEQQARNDYRDFLVEQGVGSPIMLATASGKLASLVDIVPTCDYDNSRARVMHAPHGNPLDTNTLYQAATVFAVDPTVRMIVTANPSSHRYPGNHLTVSERRDVSRGDVTATILPVLDYMGQQGIHTSDQIGYSWGVKKATSTAINAAETNHTVHSMVHIEPVHVIDRGMLALGRAFSASNSGLQGYIEDADCPAFMEARKDGISALDFYQGVLSPSGVAIARSMRHGTYEDEVRAALTKQSGSRVFAAVGDASELVPTRPFVEALSNLEADFNEDTAHRVSGIVLPNERHSLANDIYLQAALVHHGLRA